MPPLVISRAYLRFIKNLESIYQKHKNSFLKPFGEILELWIAALLNSLLIEEVIFKEGVLDATLKLDLLIETGNVELFHSEFDDLLIR